MKNILNSLYYGRVVPWEKNIHSREYHCLTNQIIELENKILNSLDDTEKNNLLNLLSLKNQASCICCEEFFEEGFALAVHLIIDSMKM